MSTLRQAAQQALEALERLYNDTEIMVTQEQHRVMKGAITALRAALAEPEQNPFGDDAERYARKLREERESYKAIFTEKPSGSFVLWENTLCNPLADSRSMAHSAWHDGYASGVKAEREECEKLCDAIDGLIGAIETVGMQIGARKVLTKACNEAALVAAAIRSRT